MVFSRSMEFEHLAQQHLDALYTRALQLEPNMQRVEDLVGLTFLRAFELFGKFHRDDDFKTWLYGLLDDIFHAQQPRRHAA